MLVLIGLTVADIAPEELEVWYHLRYKVKLIRWEKNKVVKPHETKM
jgi:hypothetical protein